MFIILFLQNAFKLYYRYDTTVSDLLQINNIDFFMDDRSKELDGFIGFFDWLRKNNHTIVGIRTCFFDQMYNNLLASFNYTNPTFDGMCIEVLFTDAEYDSSLSGDQDFTHNYVYKSTGEEYLFTFKTDWLTDEELRGLLQHCELLD